MKERIGLIQTRGIGDIIIALPIADFFIEQGHEVYWPVDESFVSFFRDAKPEINFIPVPPDFVAVDAMKRYYLDVPLKCLQDVKCDRIIPLYIDVEKVSVADPVLARSLKFDEYKYAVAGVPFARKWKLRIRRNPGREKELHTRLGIAKEYICVHTTGSECSISMAPSPEWQEKYQIIEMHDVTENPFDWIYTLEHASKLVLLDSCYSNLVEGLNLQVSKCLILRSITRYTPVMLNGWEFIGMPPAPAGTPPSHV